MSVYKTLDEGIASEIRVDDVSPRRRALNAAAIGIVTARNDPFYARKALPSNLPLSTTFKWVAGLPREMRPLALLQQFPRIANQLANAWIDPVAFRDDMFDLLIDRRGARKGFPPEVESELLALRAHFDEAHPHKGSRSPRTFA